MKLITLVLSLLLTITTRSTRANENDIILKKNDKAPFYGVLVSEPRYKYYTEQVEIADYYQANKSNLIEISSINHDELYYAGAGILVGVLIGIAVGGK